MRCPSCGAQQDFKYWMVKEKSDSEFTTWCEQYFSGEPHGCPRCGTGCMEHESKCW